ncbi:DUF427 domain-containing protein [Arthrobacter sp. U41]|uniref:DUF427 domain-containing protein n=1 Tax=Arthrobacter sp. U41 TaxID=1849032 RepID=UPI000859374B|nr:DUF427 domain-containing protein [Arthrobacter sp. U41]AOT03264.1 hypothetical protein ASPU41_07850 [Arthrobacter sp. U41]
MAVRLRSEMRALAHGLRYEPTPRRIRADAGGRTVVDSQDALLVFEPRKLTPVFAVPEADIAADLLPSSPGRAGGGTRSHFANHTAEGQELTVRSGGLELPAAAFRVADPDLAGHVLLDFGAFDQWREEDQVIEGHPRDPFHRVDARASSRRVSVGYESMVLAESAQPVFVYETMLPVRTYLPRGDVDFGLLERTSHSTICPYKGTASYWSVKGAGTRGENIAWSYEQPLQDATQLTGLIAFYDERTTINVEGKPAVAPR